jgi:uncharacterized protein YjiS (DUF1127 family)
MPTMTNAFASTHGRSLASMLDVSVTGTVDRLRAAWTKYATYRKTLSELRNLSTRALRDLDFNRGDLATIARRDVYGR